MAELRIRTPAGEVPASLAEPADPPRGGVVVVQEAFGLTDHIIAVTERLAAAGWLAVAPALFHRAGSPVFGYDDLPSVLPVLRDLTAEGIEADLDAAFGALVDRGVPVPRLGVIGFCLGGSVAMATAARLGLGAAVTYYGGGVTEGRFGLPPLVSIAPELRTPWLGLYGDLDSGIPVEQVEHLREAAGRASVPTEVVRYPDAEHGFNCDDRASHHPAAAADAWSRTLAWFDEHLT